MRREPDMETCFRWRNDPRINRWTRQSDLLNWANHETWFWRHQTDSTVKMYGISRDGTHVGVCGLTSIDRENQRAEFSLYIGPEYMGSGYGHAALKTLLRHAFETLNLNCVWGESFDGNRAISMFEKVGMKKEGTRRAFYYRNGAYHDAHLFSILRDDWRRLLPGWVEPKEEDPTKDPKGSGREDASYRAGALPSYDDSRGAH